MRTWPRLLVASIGVSMLWAGAVQAQPRDRDRDHPPARERFHSPHWVLDGRFHHDHYYPAAGYVVATLPAGPLAITFGGVPYYFQAGVWFRPARGGFVVVAPPIGVAVPVLPPAYSTLWIGGVPYYYANDTFYAAAPSGGYAVVAPPVGVETATVQPVGPPPAPPTAPPAAPTAGYWHYCGSARAYYPTVPSCPEPWVPVPAGSR